MRFTRPATVSVVLAAPVFAYAQEPEAPEAEQDLAEEYASKGTLDAGGSVGVSITDSAATVSATPTVGYFIADRIQIAAQLTLAYERVEDAETDTTSSSTSIAATLEPSYHLPLSDDLLLAGGLGLGGGYDGEHPDFEVVPRVGLDVVTDRANVITPSIRLPILIGRSHGDDGEVGTDVGVALDIGIKTTW